MEKLIKTEKEWKDHDMRKCPSCDECRWIKLGDSMTQCSACGYTEASYITCWDLHIKSDGEAK